MLGYVLASDLELPEPSLSCTHDCIAMQDCIVVYGTAVLFDDRLLSGDSSRVLKKCRIHTIVVLIAMRVIFEAETQTSGFDPAPRCTAKSVVSSFR